MKHLTHSLVIRISLLSFSFNFLFFFIYPTFLIRIGSSRKVEVGGEDGRRKSSL